MNHTCCFGTFCQNNPTDSASNTTEVVKKIQCTTCAERELFDMVYNWGKCGVITDHKCNAFQLAVERLRTGKEPKKKGTMALSQWKEFQLTRAKLSKAVEALEKIHGGIFHGYKDIARTALAEIRGECEPQQQPQEEKCDHFGNPCVKCLRKTTSDRLYTKEEVGEMLEELADILPDWSNKLLIRKGWAICKTQVDEKIDSLKAKLGL